MTIPTLTEAHARLDLNKAWRLFVAPLKDLACSIPEAMESMAAPVSYHDIGLATAAAHIFLCRALVAEAKLAKYRATSAESPAPPWDGIHDLTGEMPGEPADQFPGWPTPSGKAGEKQAGHPGFLAILDELRALHVKKSRDYGTDKDPFENIRQSAESGVEPWRGAWIRANDKVVRIKQYCRTGELANESVEDSLLDLAAYALIALALRRESQQGDGKVAA